MDIGYIFLLLVFIGSLYSCYNFYNAVMNRGKRASRYAKMGERGVFFYTAFMILAYVLLTYYFIARDFDVIYVYQYSDTHLSLGYTISAVWAGREGSLLLWALFVSILNVLFLKIEKKDEVTAFTLMLSSLVVAFFTFIMLTLSNPFARWGFNPGEGVGLNPLLRTPEMAFHPPTVFLGYAGATYPFAIAIASVYLKKENWHLRIRFWTLISWIFLTIGIFLGGWWAYKTLGWGGFWAWDPVENASLLPWLTTTALLHGIMKDKVFRKWNYWLSVISFALVILATFITRSGIIESVHAFGENPEGWLYLILIAISALFAIYIYTKKLSNVKTLEFEIFSRDFTILLNILILILATVTVLIGTIAPSILGGVSVGREFYDTVETPLAVILTILVGVCVAIGWRADSVLLKRVMFFSIPAGLGVFAITFIAGKMFFVSLASGIGAFTIVSHIMTFRKVDLRNPRKFGGYVVHVGMILIAIGVAGSWMHDEIYTNIVLTNENGVYEIISENFGKITVELKSIDQLSLPDRTELIISVDLFENGKLLKSVTPKILIYNLNRQDNVVYTVSILSEPLKDVYIAISGFRMDGVILEVHLIPLVSLVWIGSALMIAGGIVSVAMRPKEKEQDQ